MGLGLDGTTGRSLGWLLMAKPLENVVGIAHCAHKEIVKCGTAVQKGQGRASRSTMTKPVRKLRVAPILPTVRAARAGAAGTEKRRPACKPGSVPPRRAATVIYLAGRLPGRSSSNPGVGDGA